MYAVSFKDRIASPLGLALTLALACAASLAAPRAGLAQSNALQLTKTIPMPGVSSKFDHLTLDAAGDRLFIAATTNHSVEIIDLKTGKVEQSLTGLGKPHGLAWAAATGTLYVSDGSQAELRIYAGSPLTLTGKIKLSDDADDMVFDERKNLLFVGHGGSDAANPARVAVIDTARAALVANLPAATHPEGLALDPDSQRIFANIADSGEVMVIDAEKTAISAHWKLKGAADNVPLALDADDHLLFVACRTPGTLLALDAATGNQVASLPAAGGADDLFYDPALHRVYLISGTGEVDAFQVNKDKALRALGETKTAAGAKTALFVPARNLLYVGVPGAAGHASEVRVYSTVAP